VPISFSQTDEKTMKRCPFRVCQKLPESLRLRSLQQVPTRAKMGSEAGATDRDDHKNLRDYSTNGSRSMSWSSIDRSRVGTGEVRTDRVRDHSAPMGRTGGSGPLQRRTALGGVIIRMLSLPRKASGDRKLMRIEAGTQSPAESANGVCRSAVLYARVSSKEQELGYSILAGNSGFRVGVWG